MMGLVCQINSNPSTKHWQIYQPFGVKFGQLFNQIVTDPNFNVKQKYNVKYGSNMDDSQPILGIHSQKYHLIV